jgi:hypothetical protein
MFGSGGIFGGILKKSDKDKPKEPPREVDKERDPDGDKLNGEVKLSPPKNALNKNKDRPQPIRSLRDERRKPTFTSLGNVPVKPESTTIKKIDKKQHTINEGVKLDVTQKKGPNIGNIENMKERNFWSNQFSKYSTEMDDFMGIRNSQTGFTNTSDYRQCFDTISHSERLSTLSHTFIAIAQSRYIIFMGGMKAGQTVKSFIRVFSIELMRKKETEESKKPANENQAVSSNAEAFQSMNGHRLNRFSDRDDGATPMVDMGFIGFFRGQLESTGNKQVSQKALVTSTDISDFGICTYSLSSNQRYIGVVFNDFSNSYMMVTIYDLPTLRPIITTKPIQEKYVSHSVSTPFFSYKNDFGEEYDPKYFYIPFKGSFYVVELGGLGTDGLAEIPRSIIADPNILEDEKNIISITKVEHKDLLIGMIANYRTGSEHTIWTWDQKKEQGFAKVAGLKLNLPSRYTLLHNTLTKDGRSIYAYTQGGKEIVKISFKNSAIKTVFKYNYESKTLRLVMVLDDGKYIIVSDSSNEVRVFRNISKYYQQIYCQFMADEVHTFALTDNRKNLIVLSERKISAIRLHLGQNCTYDVIGARPELRDISGVYYSRYRKTLRFYDRFLQSVTMIEEVKDCHKIKNISTGFTSENKKIITLEDWDRLIAWDVLTIWVIDLPGQCHNTPGLMWKDHTQALEFDLSEVVNVMEFYKASSPDMHISDVKMNLDNKYLFVYFALNGTSTAKYIEAWSLFERKLIMTFDETNYLYCILKEDESILKWDPQNASDTQITQKKDGELVFDDLDPQNNISGKYIHVTCHKVDDKITKILFLTSKRLYLYINEGEKKELKYLRFNVHLENIETLISPDGKYLAINEKNYRDILIYCLEPNGNNELEAGFEISCNFIQVLKMAFSHDSEHLVCVDEEFKMKIISIKLKKEISSFSIQDSMPRNEVELCYMEFSEYSHSLICGFRSEGDIYPKHYLFAKVPFYGTRYSPLDSIIGYYIQRYFYTSNLAEKAALCKNIVSIVHSYPHYQITINRFITGMMLLLNAPGLIEQYCAGFVDFNVVSSHGLLKYAMEKNKLFSLISYNSMFEAHALKYRENPYIDEEQIETLSKLEKTSMNNRYTRAVLGQIVFSPVRSEYGQLKKDDENIIALPLNYKPSNLEEGITKLMKEDFNTINKYHCYVTQIPLDLSIGSEFSIAFFANISNYSEEEIQTKYKVFIYHKWNQIYFLALTHSVVYWCLNIAVYFYMGKYADGLWLGIIVCILNVLFIAYELKCFSSSKHKYMKDGWNQLDLFNHLLCLATTIIMMSINHDEYYIWINILRFISSLMIGIRGLSMLVVFKPIRYITTMFFQVLIDIWPFLIVLAYVMFISTLAWSIEPQIEDASQGFVDFIVALNVIINTSMGNFNTTFGDDQQMTRPQLVLIIFVNIFSGLALLNFLISLISETYQRISEKRDYYDVLELLPVIQEIDLLFKNRKKRVKEIEVIYPPAKQETVSDKSRANLNMLSKTKTLRNQSKDNVDKAEGTNSAAINQEANEISEKINAAPGTVKGPHGSSPRNKRYLEKKDTDLLNMPSFNPTDTTLTKNSLNKKKKAGFNSNKFHYLTIIPEPEQSDQMKELKVSLQNYIKDETTEIMEVNNMQTSKIDKLKFAVKEAISAQADVKSMIQALSTMHDQLNKKIDTIVGKTQIFGSNINASNINASNMSIHEDNEEEDKHTNPLTTTINHPSRKEIPDEDDSGGSNDESNFDKEFQNNIING